MTIKTSRRQILLWGAVIPFLLISQSGAAETDASSAQARWNSLSAEQKNELLKRYRELKALTPERQAAMRESLQHFEALPAAEQERIRKNWLKWKSMSAEAQSKVRANYARFQALPPEMQKRIRARFERWKNMDHEKREEMRKHHGA